MRFAAGCTCRTAPQPQGQTGSGPWSLNGVLGNDGPPDCAASRPRSRSSASVILKVVSQPNGWLALHCCVCGHGGMICLACGPCSSQWTPTCAVAAPPSAPGNLGCGLGHARRVPVRRVLRAYPLVRCLRCSRRAGEPPTIDFLESRHAIEWQRKFGNYGLRHLLLRHGRPLNENFAEIGTADTRASCKLYTAAA